MPTWSECPCEINAFSSLQLAFGSIGILPTNRPRFSQICMALIVGRNGIKRLGGRKMEKLVFFFGQAKLGVGFFGLSKIGKFGSGRERQIIKTKFDLLILGFFYG